MHVLITTRDRHEQAMKTARILTEAGLFPLVWTPEEVYPQGWLPFSEADPGEEALTRHAVAHAAGRDEGLILLPMDRGWTADDALAIARAMDDNPGAMVQTRRTGNLSAREWFVVRVFSLVEGRKVHDLYAGLAGWPPALVREMNKPARLPVGTRALMFVRVLGLSVIAVPLASPKAQPARPVRMLAMDTVCFLAVFFRFAGSSILSGLVDYGLFALLLPFIGNTEITNVLARILSSMLNFTLNRTLVFQSRGERIPLLQALIRYYLLAAVVLGASTGLIYIFSTVMGFNALIVKLVVDVILYIINFLVQRELVFHKRRRVRG